MNLTPQDIQQLKALVGRVAELEGLDLSSLQLDELAKGGSPLFTNITLKEHGWIGRGKNSVRLSFKDGELFLLGEGTEVGVDVIRDEDDMSSDDPNALATQQSIKAYVDGNAGIITTSAYTIYVDGSSGNDANDGTSGSKLATIQEAIDRLPDLIAHEVTIDIANTTYSESLILENKTATTADGNIKFTGDTSTPSNVVVDGGGTGTCLLVKNLPSCPVEIEGIKFNDGDSYGIHFINCKDITINNVEITNCSDAGISMEGSTWEQTVTGLSISSNTNFGITASNFCYLEIFGSDTTNNDEIDISDNGNDGILLNRHTNGYIRYATIGGNTKALDVSNMSFGRLRDSEEGASGDNSDSIDVYASNASTILVESSSDFNHGADASSEDVS